MFHIRSYFAALASRTVPISLARTTRHVPRLDGQVNRDNTIPPVVEGDFVTHRGIAGPTGKVVAIKCLRLLSRHYEEGVGRVLCGTFIWSLLEHDNVLPLLGVTTFDNGLSTVTELIIEGNAHNYVQDPEVEPGPLLLGVAHGLRYLHEHPAGPIYHGDVTGYNVLVDIDGRALLSGFEHSFIDDPSFSMAPAAPVIGSLRWMAPEGIEGGRATAERDTWAFAMTALNPFFAYWGL
ncbi:hypothetical protein SCLCIDRAFT_959669 [Scleroderma citrinum Foug A]|uniref:Protein kinase domain-containing protein n=1 Tax=Scleroderma citrinum Foug A TaxID=1036808 RepID=A0A0C3DWK8_9AGAM|nr:hypothetical protein SCLCIDRAFT_959669 [Scleroderma citrinum Foug A]